MNAKHSLREQAREWLALAKPTDYESPADYETDHLWATNILSEGATAVSTASTEQQIITDVEDGTLRIIVIPYDKSKAQGADMTIIIRPMSDWIELSIHPKDVYIDLIISEAPDAVGFANLLLDNLKEPSYDIRHNGLRYLKPYPRSTTLEGDEVIFVTREPHLLRLRFGGDDHFLSSGVNVTYGVAKAFAEGLLRAAAELGKHYDNAEGAEGAEGKDDAE